MENDDSSSETEEPSETEQPSETEEQAELSQAELSQAELSQSSEKVQDNIVMESTAIEDKSKTSQEESQESQKESHEDLQKYSQTDSQEVSQTVSQKVSQEVLQEGSHEVSQEVSQHVSQQISQASQDVSHQVSQVVSQEVSQQVVQVSQHVSQHVSQVSQNIEDGKAPESKFELIIAADIFAKCVKVFKGEGKDLNLFKRHGISNADYEDGKRTWTEILIPPLELKTGMRLKGEHHRLAFGGRTEVLTFKCREHGHSYVKLEAKGSEILPNQPVVWKMSCRSNKTCQCCKFANHLVQITISNIQHFRAKLHRTRNCHHSRHYF